MSQAWTWNKANEEKAKRRFGVKEYRPGQRELIKAVLQRRDALGILPTGGGKSLCYQLPALFLRKAILVVSPLISLMQDQHEKLTERRIQVAKLNSTLTASEEREAVADIEGGDLELIYVTPERLENPDYVDLLKESGVSLFVVDEAHCISQWGHDFRPAYLALRDAIRKLGRPPVLALTATATPRVSADILKQLGMKDAFVINTGIERQNLIFEVARTVNNDEKLERLKQIISEKGQGIGIVYVATVKLANELWRQLRTAGVNAARYHGKLKSTDRERTQQGFMNDEYDVIVATKAFGLGIDKSDIRFVVHYTFPDSIETYVQEAGRAGRDGKPARGILFYRLEDKRIQSYFLGGKYPRREESLQVYRTLQRLTQDWVTPDGFARERPRANRSRSSVTLKELVESSGMSETRVKVIVALLEASGIVERGRQLRKVRDFPSNEAFDRFLREYEERHQGDRERLEAMMDYGQSTMCRVRMLNAYFGQVRQTDCGRCDNCRGGFTTRKVDVAALMRATIRGKKKVATA
jgi:ATP-dependent DNA helicase RecQ